MQNSGDSFIRILVLNKTAKISMFCINIEVVRYTLQTMRWAHNNILDEVKELEYSRDESITNSNKNANINSE
uniref:Uncharacterized protein n=1 Tax=Arion vulgaris TaxID=1028688 RepID=A0A0B7ATA5_9EUPU